MEEKNTKALFDRIRSLGDKLAEDLAMLPDKSGRIEPVLSATPELVAEPAPRVVRRRQGTEHAKSAVVESPVADSPDVTEDFIVTPDGHTVTNPDTETVEHLIEGSDSTTVHPPLPAAPAEAYSSREIVNEFPTEKEKVMDLLPHVGDSGAPIEAVGPEEVLKKFGVRTREDGVGVEVDPSVEFGPLPSPVSPEDEAQARKRIREELAIPDPEEGAMENEPQEVIVTPGSEAEAEVLRAFLPESETTLPKENGRLKTLEQELAEARQRYVAVDLEKSSALLRLRNLLSFKQGVPSEDVDDARARYEEARLKFTQERLAQVEQKYAGDRSDVYKREMAEVLNFGEFEGRVQLFEARKQAEIERKSSSVHGRITEKLSQWMHAYNGLKWYEKLAIGGALVGVTAAGGAAAFGAAFARAALAGGSLSVTLDAALEGRSDARARQQAEESGQKIFDKIAEIEAQTGDPDLTMDDEARAEKMREFEASVRRFAEQHLAAEKTVAHLFHERVDAMKRRKLMIGASGAALGLVIGKGWIGDGIQHVVDHGTGIEWLDQSLGLAALPNESLPVEDAPAAVPADTHPVPGAPEHGGGVPRVEGFSPEYSNFLKPADVKPGDNFWNLLSERTRAFGLNDSQSRYLLDLIKDKAAALSPSEARELGIASGDITKLHPGDRIDFTRLLGTQDLDKYLSEARGLSETVASHVSQPSVSNVDTVRAAALAKVDAALAASTPPVVVDTPVVESVVTEAVPNAASELAPEYVPRVNDWYAQIFQIENPAVGQDIMFNRAEIMRVKVSDIIRDMQAFTAGQVTGYRSNLSPEQYRNFYEFAAGLQKAGVVSMTEFLRSNVDGTVEEYLKQAAPKATAGSVYGIFSTNK